MFRGPQKERLYKESCTVNCWLSIVPVITYNPSSPSRLWYFFSILPRFIIGTSGISSIELTAVMFRAEIVREVIITSVNLNLVLMSIWRSSETKSTLDTNSLALLSLERRERRMRADKRWESVIIWCYTYQLGITIIHSSQAGSKYLILAPIPASKGHQSSSLP